MDNQICLNCHPKVFDPLTKLYLSLNQFPLTHRPKIFDPLNIFFLGAGARDAIASKKETTNMTLLSLHDFGSGETLVVPATGSAHPAPSPISPSFAQPSLLASW